MVTYRICLGLQQHDREVLEHGIETGVIRRLPNGEFIEVHQPLGPVDEHGHGTLAYGGAPVPKRMNHVGGARRAIRGFFTPIEEPTQVEIEEQARGTARSLVLRPGRPTVAGRRSLATDPIGQHQQQGPGGLHRGPAAVRALAGAPRPAPHPRPLSGSWAPLSGFGRTAAARAGPPARPATHMPVPRRIARPAGPAMLTQQRQCARRDAGSLLRRRPRTSPFRPPLPRPAAAPGLRASSGVSRQDSPASRSLQEPATAARPAQLDGRGPVPAADGAREVRDGQRCGALLWVAFWPT